MSQALGALLLPKVGAGRLRRDLIPRRWTADPGVRDGDVEATELRDRRGDHLPAVGAFGG
nr:hypothetical protein [Mycobacterium numidiamassiliense]